MRVLKDIEFSSLNDLITFVEMNKIHLIKIIDVESNFLHIHTKDSFLLSLKVNSTHNNFIKSVVLDFSPNATCYQDLSIEWIIE